MAGRVGRPHGLDGSFYVVDASPDLLPAGATVMVAGEPTEVVARKGTAERPILRLAIAADRTAVEALRGAELRVARADAPPLDDDEYWAEDLVGCEVVADDRVLGVVARLVAYPSCEVLVVDEHLVPMVGDAIRSVDVAARRIEVDAAFLGL